MASDILIVGSLNMDIVVRSPRIPKPGETILGSEMHMIPGGKGANQAVAAARLGARATMVGRLGQDAFAKPLLENLEASQIDHTYVISDSVSTTGVALIVVDDIGENSIVVASGSNMRLSPADIDNAEAAFKGAKVVLLQLENPKETVLRAAELARAHSVRVILNPAPAQTLPKALLALVDVLIPNETETAQLTGMPVSNLEDLKEAAAALLVKGVGAVILTLGDQGALLTRESDTILVPAYKVNVIDTTAAGDAFVGGFSVAFAEGKPMEEAVRWGNAAGALAATKLGAQTSLPGRPEVEALLATDWKP
jgi:ribokinase